MANHLTPDDTTTRVETVGVSPKTWVASAAAAGMGTIAAILELVQGDPTVFGIPAPWGLLVAVGLPPIIAFLATYAAGPGSVREKL